MSLLSPRPVTLGATSCHGPVVDGHHSHASLIPAEYQISWNAVLRHRWRYRNFPLTPPKLAQLLCRLRRLSFVITKPMCSMNDFDQPLPSSFSSPLPVDFWMPRAAARAMALLATPPATLSNRPYVCTCWWTTTPKRTGCPRRWCSNWVAWPPVGYAVLSLFWRHQTVDSVTPREKLVLYSSCLEFLPFSFEQLSIIIIANVFSTT